MGLKGFRNGDGCGESRYLSMDNMVMNVYRARSLQRIYGLHFQAEMDAVSVTAHIFVWNEGGVFISLSCCVWIENFTFVDRRKWTQEPCLPGFVRGKRTFESVENNGRIKLLAVKRALALEALGKLCILLYSAVKWLSSSPTLLWLFCRTFLDVC